jgi:CheY-like chemotaxis protein
MSLAREFAPDAILIDIGLPVMDGLQVARRGSTGAETEQRVADRTHRLWPTSNCS